MKIFDSLTTQNIYMYMLIHKSRKTYLNAYMITHIKTKHISEYLNIRLVILSS